MRRVMRCKVPSRITQEHNGVAVVADRWQEKRGAVSDRSNMGGVWSPP
jgi:hypothetical protein